jgi:magnesium transporter
MTTFVVYNIDQARPDTGAFTFILTGNRLVTVRYHEPRSLPQFVVRAEKGAVACRGPAAVAVGLVETIIHREADLIERVQDEVDRLALQIFDARHHEKTRQKRLDLVLGTLGRQGDITSRVEEAAFSLERMLTFFTTVARQRGEDAATLARIEDAHRDIITLREHAQFLSNRASFLLDATLGMISIEQNQIIKLFSVVAVMLMPPTLVASIYGMNFKHMPELEWGLGYPLALAVMVLAAVLPYLYFRRKGWL